MSKGDHGRLVYRCRRCGGFFHGDDFGGYYGPSVRLVFKRDAYTGQTYMGLEPCDTMRGQRLPPEDIHQCSDHAQGIGDLAGIGELPTAKETR